MESPVWLKEEVWIQDLLNWFLDRVEKPRDKAITRRISKSTALPLFQFGNNTNYYWGLIESLAKDYQVFEIRCDNKLDAHQERYENAQLRFNPKSEAMLRVWLNRPRQNPTTLLWKEALESFSDFFVDKGESLLNTQPTIDGYTPGEMLELFVALEKHFSVKLTLRELSARCFKGDSKFLDNRLDLLFKLFGNKVDNIIPRPLLLTAWAPTNFEKLLIIENQDTFLRIVDASPKKYALLYSGGFRASAERLSSEHTRFAFLPGSDSEVFKQKWLSISLPTFFWGDLDYSGIGIFKAIKQVIPQLEAWKPAYENMMEQLPTIGHTPAQAGKSGQAHPGLSECEYIDSVALPLLEKTGKFLDQETISITNFLFNEHER